MKEDRMRICLISFAFSPLVGGSEIQAEKQARHLQAHGHEVIILTMRQMKWWKRTEMLDGLPVVRVGGLYRRNGQLRIGRSGHPFMEISAFLTLWRMRHQYNIIHVMQISPIAAVATLICKLTRKPIIINIQSAGPDAQQQARQKKEGITLMTGSLPQADFFKIKASDWTAGDLEFPRGTMPGGRILVDLLRRSEAYYQVLSSRCYTYLTDHGFPPERIERIPNGVDTEKFRPATVRPDPAQPQRDILCVARLEYPKGVDVLLHAWSHMLQSPPQWRAHVQPRLRIVGKGVFRPQMECIAAGLGIQDSVEFLGLRTDVVELLQQAWGFVLPSRWEGMPNALLEAMACGLPCVATCVSGSKDIIVEGINGWLVEPEQPAAMALALQRMIAADSTLASSVRQNARTTILRDYQLTAITSRCLHLYRRLLSPVEASLAGTGSPAAIESPVSSGLLATAAREETRNL